MNFGIEVFVQLSDIVFLLIGRQVAGKYMLEIIAVMVVAENIAKVPSTIIDMVISVWHKYFRDIFSRHKYTINYYKSIRGLTLNSKTHALEAHV